MLKIEESGHLAPQNKYGKCEFSATKYGKWEFIVGTGNLNPLCHSRPLGAEYVLLRFSINRN